MTDTKPSLRALSSSSCPPSRTLSIGGRAMFDAVRYNRRHLLAAAAASVVADRIDDVRSARARTNTPAPAGLSRTQPSTTMSFGPVQQIDAGLLNVGYVEA